jgi:hypothetical protein
LALAAVEVAVNRDFAQQTTDVQEPWRPSTWSWRGGTSSCSGGASDYGTALSSLGTAVRSLRCGAAADRAGTRRPRLSAVHIWAGVLTDNLLGRSDEALTHCTTALELGEKTDDRLLISYALRHLGDHAHTAGDLEPARKQSERSTELRQEVRHLLGALAQRTSPAILLRDEEDTAGSKALATGINRWSRQFPSRPSPNKAPPS